MNEVLLVAVIALAISLLSIVINLMLVFKISNLKDHVEWIEKAPIDSLNIRDNILNDKITKLGKDTKDAFEKVTNHLTIHDDQIDKLIENYGEAEIQVAKNTEQLDQLGRFAGITTGELRVLEQKIYNISKNEPDYMCKWVSDAEKKLIEIDRIKESIENKRNYIEESRNRVDIKAQNDELFGIRQRVSILEKKLEVDIKRGSEMKESISLCHEHTNSNNNQLNRLGERLSVVEIKLAKAFEEFNQDLKDIRRAFDVHKVDLINHFLELNRKITTGQKIDNVMPEDSKIREYRRKKHKIEYNERIKKMGDPYK